MAEGLSAEIIVFQGEMTCRWPCEAGDFLLWLGYPNVLAGPESIRCYDVWGMPTGSQVTITNRMEDLPDWFRLHPSEVCDRLVFKMMAKVKAGDYPEAPMDGPNIWRLKAGDRVAWVGREGTASSSGGKLSILVCREAALALREPDSLDEFVGVGPLTRERRREAIARFGAAVSAVQKLGLPREWEPDWKLG